MFFNRGLLLVFISLLSACATQTTMQDSTETQVVAQPVVNDYSDYAEVGLITVEAEYQQTFKKAVAALRKKHYQQAEQLLETLIKQRPDLVMPLYNLALLRMSQQKNAEALELLTSAHFIDPANDKVCSALGRGLREQGQFKEAKKVYGVCLSFEDQSPIVHKNYGILLDLYLHQGDLALKQYQIYLDRTGDSDKQVKGWVLDLQRRLKAAEGQ